MDNYFRSLDAFAVRYTQLILRYRWLVILGALLFAFGIGTGAQQLQFSSNYRVFFSNDNPELTAFEQLQTTYTKNDNFLFVIEPEDGRVFSNDTLSAVEKLTNEAWQIPFAIRVDSITNFQHTYGTEEGLIVEDLVKGAGSFSDETLKHKSDIALNEPLLYKQLISADGSATAVNVILQYPDKDLNEIPRAAEFARQLRNNMESAFPNLTVSLTGVSMLNNAFMEAGITDMATLVPLMFVVILAITLLILRSVSGTIATLGVIMTSTMVAMGMAGFFGVKLTPISGSAPTVILTLAIADSIHILMSWRTAMREGMAKLDAMVEAVRLNFIPVAITSITTIVGFLALNFSDAPPFWHLGNTSAVGIAAAWLFTMTLLPAMIAVLPVRIKQRQDGEEKDSHAMDVLSDFVIRHYRKLLLGLGAGVAVVISFIPSMAFDDQWVEYFDERIEFRRDSDQALKQFGMYPIEYSVPARGPGGVSQPEYLEKLEAFTEFLRDQEVVTHVYSLSDIIKRLNLNMHEDDRAYYKIPDDNNLSAQYLLLYELSLPYGLDLNDRINIDKSATRVTATLAKTTTAETKVFLEKTRQWMAENFPDYMQSRPTSAQVMFTYITDRNVESMIKGTIVAVLAIALIMVVALRSVSMGLLSLIPNGLPILVTFGTWALLVGEVGFSFAAIASISLGIIVDDTVHFLSKYMRGRQERTLSTENAIRYAFRNVGSAILVNTIILVIGFLVLTTSSFKLNVDMGLLTALAIGFALVLDFLLLPALLLMFSKDTERHQEEGEIDMLQEPRKLATATSTVSVLTLGVFVAASLSLFTPAANATELTPERGNTKQERKGFMIAARADRSDRGFLDSKVGMTMVLRNASGAETRREMSFYTLEMPDESVGDKSMIVFASPPDIKGTALLSHAKILKPDNQWLYLPALKRIKRISSANKSGPFVGSEFAFEDFTALELNKFDYTWNKDEACGDLQCDVVTRIPRYENSGYSKQVVWIDTTDHQIRKVEFYDRRGDLLKTLSLDKYSQYNDIWRPHLLSMVNHQTGKSTDLVYDNYTFKTGLNDKDFIKTRLKRMR